MNESKQDSAHPERQPRRQPPAYDIVAMAASAGGLQALDRVLEQLPTDFGAGVVIVQHLDPRHRSLLATVLARHSTLPVQEARAGSRIQAGLVFVAPPDRHLEVDAKGWLSLSEAAPEHFVRPAADALFRSVANAYGPRAIAVVLTGLGVDGADGVRAIKKMGGMVLAQDRETSEFSGMPQAAVDSGCVDFIVPLDKIHEVLIALVTAGVYG